MKFTNLDCPRVAIENPVCIMSTVWRKPDQIIQPWQFGHGETKATCLWLKGLPTLSRQILFQGVSKGFGKCRQVQNEQKQEVRLFRGLPWRWRNNGEMC